MMVRSVIFFPCLVHGWTDSGHMLTAKIASLGLEPEVRDFFDSITDRLYSPELKSVRKGTTFDRGEGKKDDLTSVATWPDNMDIAFPFQKIWHFSDKTVELDPSACKIQSPWDGVILKDNDFVLAEAENDLHPPHKNYPQDVIYGLTNGFFGVTADVSKWNDPAIDQFQQSFWLRSFVHYLGDAHQPLHCANGCSKSHPKGDFGGNLFKIKTNIVNDFEDHHTKVSELHLLWDLVGGTYAKGPNWPLNATGEVFIEQEATRIREKFLASPDKEDIEKEISWIESKECSPVKAFLKIRDESWNLAKSVVYTDIIEGELVSDAYLKRAQEVAEKRVAWGGFRLQAFLKKMYTAITQNSGAERQTTAESEWEKYTSALEQAKARFRRTEEQPKIAEQDQLYL